ncbi:MAG TPA: flagellar filament capping protein FliD [Jatrophihabitans sp.]|nr:flagellar filament capping protein FliD [Jatrophihabitans sp.]
MSSFSVGGLASGIDTTSLISQLMTVAAQPQTALKNQLATEQSVVSEYQAINAKLTAFQTAANALSQSSAWAAAKATASTSSVIATTTAGATIGSSATFDVVQLATAQVSTVAVPSGGTVVSTPANGIDITDSTGTVHHLSLADGSASTVAAAVNTAGIGVRASLVNTDSGQVLQFTASSTGQGGSFSVAGLDTAPQTLVAAQDAKVAVGNQAAGGYTVSSSTNTFTNVVPGVTFTVGAVASNVTITVGSDASAISDKVKAMVDAANSLLGELQADTGKGALLEGNYQINAISQSVLSLVSHGDTTGASFASSGVQLTSVGSLAFDATAFAAAYNADPAGTQTKLSGLASSVSSLALNTSTQTVSPLISSGNSQVANLTKEISDWDTRLATEQTTLQAKYTAMEVALQKLNSTSSWLTQALNSTTNSSSSSSSSK